MSSSAEFPLIPRRENEKHHIHFLPNRQNLGRDVDRSSMAGRLMASGSRKEFQALTSICLRICSCVFCFFALLALNGIQHCWTYSLFFSWGLNQMEVLKPAPCYLLVYSFKTRQVLRGLVGALCHGREASQRTGKPRVRG